MYEKYYNLKENPFKLTPDPNYFFGSKGHNRVLAYLHYGVQQGDGFIVVTGDIGAGKTTLVRTLLLELEKFNDVVAAQLVTTQLEPKDLLGMILESFGLTHQRLTKPAMLKKLEAYLKKKAKEGKRVLLIIDEAQNLPVSSLEELRMLSNYQEGDKQLFQSFLVGQEGFRIVLNSDNLEQLRQRVIASYHLGPLNLAETHEYIEHRLILSGWKKDPKFNEKAVASIYGYTGGIPRRINLLCNRILLYCSMSETHLITDKTVKIVTQELDEEVVGLTGNKHESITSKKYHTKDKDEVNGTDRDDLVRRVEIVEKFLHEFEKMMKKYSN